jgi:hypothetical protein
MRLDDGTQPKMTKERKIEMTWLKNFWTNLKEILTGGLGRQ